MSNKTIIPTILFALLCRQDAETHSRPFGQGGGMAALLVLGCFLLAQPALAESHFAELTTLTNSRPAVAITNAQVSATTATNAPDASSTNNMADLNDVYRLAIGDTLSYRIIEDEEDPKGLLVTDSGDLEFPYIGRFPATGRTCKELAYALKAALEKEYYKQATVIVAVDLKTKSRGKVYLVGPVRMPGPQEIPSDEVLTLSKAILRAGGFGDFADKRNVRVTRKEGGKDKAITVNVGDVLEKGKTDLDLRLEPGDLIYIPERSIRF
jgi:polysaccharide biosynthesis/export protein